MMTPRVLRAMVIASWVVLIATYVLNDLIAGADRHVSRLEAYDGYGAILQGNVFYVVPIIVTTVACVGIFFLQNWGRMLFLAYCAYTIVTALLFGYRVATAFEAFLGTIGGTLNGAILAVCFLAPYNRWFERRAAG